MASDRARLDKNLAFLHKRSRKDRRALPLFHRERLSGYRRLVHKGLAACDGSVNRNHAAASNRDQVAFFYKAYRNGFFDALFVRSDFHKLDFVVL